MRGHSRVSRSSSNPAENTVKLQQMRYVGRETVIKSYLHRYVTHKFLVLAFKIRRERVSCTIHTHHFVQLQAQAQEEDEDDDVPRKDEL